MRPTPLRRLPSRAVHSRPRSAILRDHTLQPRRAHHLGGHPYAERGSQPATLHDRLTKVLTALGVSYELVMVDDGSTDETHAEIVRLRQQDPRVKYIRLARNFGHQAALTAGLAHASGKAVIAIDADLQDPPEMICDLAARWQQDSTSCTLSPAQERVAPKRFAYALFYRLLHRIAPLDILSTPAIFV